MNKEQTESQIQDQIMAYLLTEPAVSWAFVTSVGVFKGRGGSRFTVGFPGLSDIIGQLKGGRILAIEVKKPGGRVSDAQKSFIRQVNRDGGLAMSVTDVDQVVEAFKLFKVKR